MKFLILLNFGHSAVNKKYVDGEITKIDTTPFVKLDGSRAMTGNLDMGGKKITGVGDPTLSIFSTDAINFRSLAGTLRGFKIGLNMSFVHLDGSEAMTGNLDMGDHLIQKVSEPVNSDDVATKNYVDAEIGYISTPFLKLDGMRAMTGVLNMNDHKISNLKMPEFNTDAANKQYIDEALLKSHLVSSHIENAFKYLLDQDESSSEKNIIVNGIQDFNGSPHKNKKAYSIDLVYTPVTQNYDSKIGINLYSLPIGKYTIIMEYYFPEDINISLLAEASTAIINKQTITHFPSYKKQLVQINQQTKDTPDYLFFTIRGSGTTATNPEGYLVFYGVKEWVDTVPSEIYDHVLETGMFEYDNGNMKIFHDIDLNNNKIINSSGIDMNNHKIINLKDAVNKNDVINKGQLDEFKNEFDRYRFFVKNHSFLNIFSYLVFDFNEPGTFIVKFFNREPYISGIASNETPSLNISSTLNKRITYNNFKPKKGIQFSSSHRLIMELDYNVDEHSSYTMLIIMTLKDNLKLYFIEPTQGLISYYPVYIINKVRRTLSI